ncbi:methyltransferase domain-containing protein [Fragilaria crotonensis]|nr:methyltransferase domain-containing protein [Fragilaria crotonensis]
MASPGSDSVPSHDNGECVPPNKKAKVDDSPPPYESQEYWDTRYKKHQTPNDKLADHEVPDTDAMPYHAWYFTYSDLRPLVLPLLLGGKNTGKVDGDLFDGESDQFKVTAHDMANNECATSNTSEDVKGQTDASKPDVSANEEPANESDDDNEDDEDSEFVEVDENDEDDDDDETQEREGVASDGPVSVLEVGCGDVPLGRELAIELISLEKNGTTKVNAVIKKIVCCDYSPTLIAMLNKQKQESKGLNSDDLATLDTILDYQASDARSMPQYLDRSFEMVLEKGTLDAMLSDKEAGISNCQKIVTEMARVLTVGGYIVLVSHLNAHTKNGIEWLHEVVLPGLRAGDQDWRWEIEVHGNDGIDDIDNQDHATQTSPGPCVYVIHKLDMPVEEKDGSTTSIPLSFFTY